MYVVSFPVDADATAESGGQSVECSSQRNVRNVTSLAQYATTHTRRQVPISNKHLEQRRQRRHSTTVGNHTPHNLVRCSRGMVSEVPFRGSTDAPSASTGHCSS
jgi:hypothetical protein